MNRLLPFGLAGLFALALAACGGDDAGDADIAAASESPTDAIVASAQRMKEGDLLGAVKLSVPPEHFERMKAEWRESVENDPPSEEERRQFAETMSKLTAPDAEQQLYAELEPQLQVFETEMAPQIPLWIGMGRGFAVQSIEASEDLTPPQKQQATQTLDAVAAWLGSVDLTDRDKVKTAIGHAVETARAVDLQTMEQVGELEFEQMLEKGGVVFTGLKDVLRVYGLDLDKSFDSVKAELVSETGDTATVRVDYTLFDRPLSFETEMVKVDDRWYGKQTIEGLQKSLEESEEPIDPATIDPAIDAPGAEVPEAETAEG